MGICDLVSQSQIVFVSVWARCYMAVTVTRKRKSGFPPERCYKCKEAIVGNRRCKCTTGRMPRGPVWINGMLRLIDGCATCGSTLHSSCVRETRAPE